MGIEVILGIGTVLILGFQVWILWRQSKISDSQKKISQEQSTYLMRKDDPKADIQKIEHDGDKLILNIINLGGTKAVGVALKTDIHIVKPEVVKKEDQIFVSTRGDWDLKKQTNFKDGDTSYTLGSSVLEMYRDKSDYPELEVNHNRKFTQEVTFGLYDKKGEFPTPTKTVSFKQLLSLLKENNVLGCEIIISLVYKNLSNKLVETKQIEKFYIMPPKLKSKTLSELNDEDKLKGGMRYEAIHPFMKQKANISKSEETYRSLDHCER